MALARRIGRPYLEVGCLGHLALAAAFSGSPVPVGVAAERGSDDDRRGARMGDPSHRRSGCRSGGGRARVARSPRRGGAVAGRGCSARRRAQRSSRSSPCCTTRTPSCGSPSVGSRRRCPSSALRTTVRPLVGARARAPGGSARLDPAHAGSAGRDGGGACDPRGPSTPEERDGAGDAHRRRGARARGGPPAGRRGRRGADDRGRAGDACSTALRRWSTCAGRPSTRC